MVLAAAWARTGWPPFTLSALTVPSGATSASTLTTPARAIVRASAGYGAAGWFTGLRLEDDSCWAREATAARRVQAKSRATKSQRQVKRFLNRARGFIHSSLDACKLR